MISVVGCGKRLSTDAMRRQVLTADPGFSKPLEKRDQVADRVNVLRQELALKQAQVDGKITQLRKELRETKTQALQKIEETRQGLSPERERVELALAMAQEEQRVKQQQRQSLGRSISRLRKSLQESRSSWSAKERQRIDRELTDLVAELKRVDQELSVLQQHVRLLGMKRELLRL